MKGKIKLIAMVMIISVALMKFPKSALTINDNLLVKTNIIGTNIKNGYEYSDYYKKGYDYYIDGDYVEAASNLERAIDLYESDKKEQSELGDIQYFLSRTYYFLGEYRASLSLSEQSMELNEKSGNRYIMNCMNIGDNHYALENYDEALEYYLIAEDNYDKTDENTHYELIEVLVSVLKVYEEMGNESMILEYGQKIDDYENEIVDENKYNENSIYIYDVMATVNA